MTNESKEIELRKVLFYMVGIAAVALVLAAPAATMRAQDAALPAAGAPAAAAQPDETEAKPNSSGSFWEILAAGGPVGMLILLLSVAAVALVIEHVMTIREPVLMPPGLGDEVRELLAAGKLVPAMQRCRREPSFLAFVLEAGLAEADGGWPAVEKAAEDASADQSARLFRKIEYLSVIGAIGPMLGLLGTVIGMILAFRKVAGAEGVIPPAELPRELAGGIYLALVTTVEGLIVAIPSLAAFAFFRNRVDQLVAEVSYVAQHVFAPLKRSRTAGRAAGSPPPPAPPPVGGH